MRCLLQYSTKTRSSPPTKKTHPQPTHNPPPPTAHTKEILKSECLLLLVPDSTRWQVRAPRDLHVVGHFASLWKLLPQECHHSRDTSATRFSVCMPHGHRCHAAHLHFAYCPRNNVCPTGTCATQTPAGDINAMPQPVHQVELQVSVYPGTSGESGGSRPRLPHRLQTELPAWCRTDVQLQRSATGAGNPSNTATRSHVYDPPQRAYFSARHSFYKNPADLRNSGTDANTRPMNTWIYLAPALPIPPPNFHAVSN